MRVYHTYVHTEQTQKRTVVRGAWHCLRLQLINELKSMKWELERGREGGREGGGGGMNCILHAFFRVGKGRNAVSLGAIYSARTGKRKTMAPSTMAGQKSWRNFSPVVYLWK